MKIILTGAAGYVGSALTGLLTSLGHCVIAVDNDARRLERLSRQAFPDGLVEYHACGLEELAGRPALLSGANAVVHLAGISNDTAAERNPELTRRVNVDSALMLAQAAKDAGIGRFLLASTVAIYQVPVGHRLEHDIFREDDMPPLGHPAGAYAQSKLAAERALAGLCDGQFVVVVLRKGSLYGYSPIMRWDLIINRMTFKVFLGEPVTLHDLGAVWRPIAHVQDAARAYLRLLELPAWSANGLAFNLAERNARLSEICLEIDDVARGALGRGIILQHGASALAQRTGRVSAESLHRVGWRPSRSLRDGVMEMLDRLGTGQIEMPEDGPAPGSAVQQPARASSVPAQPIASPPLTAQA